MSVAPRRTPIALVIAAWVVVALPLGWGLYQSVVKSRPLFASPAAATSSAPSATGGTSASPTAATR